MSGAVDTSSIDFGRTARDYARHRQGFPLAFFRRLAQSGIGEPGQRVLDLGTGTGQMARGLALGGARVIGLDPSGALLAAGRSLDDDAGVSVARVRARAEALPFSSSTCDVVCAAQCWRWFTAADAAADVRRVLVPGGRLVIAQLDWIPLPGSVVEASEQLILQHNPAWELGGLDGLPTHFLPALEQAGFERFELFAYDLDLVYSHADWRGRIRASAGIAATFDPPRVARFDAELAELLATCFSRDPLAVPHRVFALVVRAPGC